MSSWCTKYANTTTHVHPSDRAVFTYTSEATCVTGLMSDDHDAVMPTNSSNTLIS